MRVEMVVKNPHHCSGASGLVDGYTRFCWGKTTNMKKLILNTEQYIKPEVFQTLSVTMVKS